MQTFAVSDVTPSEQPLEATTLKQSLGVRLRAPADKVERHRRLEERSSLGLGRAPDPAPVIEACGANQEYLVRLGEFHPLIQAVHIAFAKHYPLVLSPDDVWLCLAQGFAMHVDANSEALRSRFVRHEGKIELQIRRDGFLRGSPDNDWQGCFAEWSDAIAAHIGKKRDLVVAGFSTTGPIERAASELILMSAMKNYFEFTLMTSCGIPAITLSGTVEDWRAIRRRTEVLAEFDLNAWVAALLPVLDQFVAAAAGKADREFWQSIYKINDDSGGPYATGWINVLFPYLDRHDGITQNPYATAWSKDMDGPFCGTELSDFPRGMSQVPLTWNYLKTKLSMTLSGGFVGVSQNPQTLAVRPAIGWAVSYASR